MPTRQNGGPDGCGGAAAGSARSPASTKRGQKHRQGIVVMSGSDDSATLATALIRPHIERDGSPFPRNATGVILQLFAAGSTAGAVRARREKEEAVAAPG
jgi:hypothetical protein